MRDLDPPHSVPQAGPSQGSPLAPRSRRPPPARASFALRGWDRRLPPPSAAAVRSRRRLDRPARPPLPAPNPPPAPRVLGRCAPPRRWAGRAAPPGTRPPPPAPPQSPPPTWPSPPGRSPTARRRGARSAQQDGQRPRHPNQRNRRREQRLPHPPTPRTRPVRAATYCEAHAHQIVHASQGEQRYDEEAARLHRTDEAQRQRVHARRLRGHERAGHRPDHRRA